MKISEIFDYGDEIVIAEQDGLFDPAEIKEATMKKVHMENRGGAVRPAKKRRSVYRMVLIAAVIAVLLAGTAFAAYQYVMQARLATDIPLFEGKDLYHYSLSGMETTDTGDSAETVSATAPEYLANAEWLDYFFSMPEADYDERLPQDSPYRTYTGWQAMAEKLQNIADKYGLRLFQESSFTNSLEEFFAFPEIGGVFMPLEGGTTVECVAQTYDDGSFLLGGVRAIVSENGAETLAIVQITRAMKGTLTDFSGTGNAPENYTCETYTTADGTDVELALGKTQSFVFAELDTCWVTIEISSDAPDMESLRQLADSVNFAMLDVS